MTYRLEGTIGPQLLSWDLEDGSHRVGRNANSEVFLPHGTVSREHAVIRIDGERIEVEDLGSRNGTFVNGRGITGSSPLSAGSRVRFGSVDLMLLAPGAPGPEGGTGQTVRTHIGTVLSRPIKPSHRIVSAGTTSGTRATPTPSWREASSAS